MPPVSVSEDIGEASGPNASLQFGDAGKMSSLNREAGVLATGKADQPQAQPQGAAPAAPQGSPPPPVQPTPQSPQNAPSDRPDNTRVQPWMPDLTPPVNLDNLQAWRNYGPTLNMLARVAEAIRGRTKPE